MTEDKTSAQAELLYNRLSKRCKHLKKWARRTLTNSFRLYDRDIPEIPLVLDLYDDAVSGAVYSRDSEKAADWRLGMKETIARALDIPENHIFLKERQRMRDRQETGNQYGRISGQNFYRDAKEGDLSYRVNLSDYLDTGLFLDARKKRNLIREAAGGKRVLNLFAYTCTLSVAAAKGGARQVDSVDLSNTYLEWGRINFALNRLNAEFVDIDAFFRHPPCPTLIRSDVMYFIREAARKKLLWDIIILDPPSFSNSKRVPGTTFDIKRDHRELIRSCLSLLSPGGKLYFSSNLKGFSLNCGDFPLHIIKDITKDLLDEDFRKIPLCYSLHDGRSI